VVLLLLVISISPVLAEDEPNDSFDQAETITTGTYSGHLNYNGNDKEDYYRITIDKGDTIFVNMTRDVGTKFDLTLYNEERNSVAKDAAANATANDTETGVDWTVNNEKDSYIYYIKVSSQSSSAVGNYTFEVETKSQDDADIGGDAGDELADSVPIPLTAISGFIKDYDEQDWYSFIVPGGASIYANISPSLNLEVEGTLYNQDKESVKTVFMGGFGATIMVDWSTNSLEGGYQYYLKVRCKDGSGTYVVDVNLAMQGDAGSGSDASDVLEGALPLVSGSYDAFCKDDDEFDYYSFDVRARTLLNITCTPAISVDYNIELQDEDGRKIEEAGSDVGIGVATNIEWTASSSETVYLRVRRYTSFGNYKLDVVIESPPSPIIARVDDTGKTWVEIEWNKCPDADFLQYRIIKADNSNFAGNTTVTTITNVDTVSYRVTGLQPGAKYYFKVIVYNTEYRTTDSSQLIVRTVADNTMIYIGIAVVVAAVAGGVGFIMWRRRGAA
jgi:hypothetical protein